MKKIFFILLFVTFSQTVILGQGFNWITPNKDYLKLYVFKDGINRINKQDFVNAGINTSGIDPRTVKVLFKGNQIPIYFFGEQDGTFDESDYFDFYGQRNYGGLTNVYKESGTSLVVDYVVNEYYNLYSDTNIYWVDWGGSYGLRFTDYSFQSSINYPKNYFFKDIHFEKDLFYFLGEKRNQFDYRNFNNERVTGEGWFWREFQRGNSLNDTFSTYGLLQGAEDCLLKIVAYPNSYTDSIQNEHRLIIRINGNIIDTIERNDYSRIDTSINFSASLLNISGVNQITFTYTGAGSYTGRLNFDNFKILYPKKTETSNGILSFEPDNLDTVTYKFYVKGINNIQSLSLYDVKNNLRITNFTNSNDTLYFSGKRNGKFEISTGVITQKPFKIKKRSVPNLISNTAGADYIIVYNKIFENQAEQLSQHRASVNNFRTFKAEIEDIYDIFNYGIENPVAVRFFTKNAYDNWVAPKFRYLLLFGRGSLDPKKNLESSVYYNNLVPVYGNPISDGYFANFNIGSYVYFPQVSVGRIPAYTTSEAQNVVNKIISNENQLPERWIKNFILITGGQNSSEQITFANQSNLIINSYIAPNPVSGLAVKIYRNDSTGGVTYNYQDSIIRSINNGSTVVNYIGHAATNVWDNGLEDPTVLNNNSRQPIVFSMTCFTGKNAETNERSFGEKFYYNSNKGAIGFVGSTGWSFSGSGNTYNMYLFQGFANDSVRFIGDLLKYASGKLKGDSLIFASKNTINCYNLIGDPASKLLFPRHPEFDIKLSDYWISNPFPTLREPIIIKSFGKNVGTFADSCKIRYELFRNGFKISQYDSVIRNFRYNDTTLYKFSLDSAGSYSVKISMDPDNWYPIEEEINNSITINLSLKNISFVPVKPVNDEVVVQDSIEFTGLNPNVDFSKNIVKVILNVDTTMQFNSPMSQVYFKNITEGVVTKFKIKPDLPLNKILFWRLNSIINNTDSSGWSEARRIVKGNITGDNSVDSLIKVSKFLNTQFATGDLSNIVFDSDGFKLKKSAGNLVAQSWGGEFFNATYFTINETQVFLIDSASYGGINIAKVRKLDGVLSEVKHIHFTSALSNDSLVNYLNTVDTNHILMFVKSIATPNTVNINQTAKNRLKQLGSIYADSLNLQNISRWSFISYRSIPNSVISEGFLRFDYTPVTVNMQPEFMSTSGSVAYLLGPGNKWSNFILDFSLNQNTNVLSDFYGINRNNQAIQFLSNYSGNNYLFDTLNSLIYPGVKLSVKLSIDSSFKLNSIPNPYLSPVLKSISYNYRPPAELCPDNNLFLTNDSVYQEGDTVNASVNIINAGYSTAVMIISKWSASSPQGIKLLKVDTLLSNLKSDSARQILANLSTSGLKRSNSKKDTVNLYYECLLKDANEFYTYNNTVLKKIVVEGDSTKPEMDITFDGTKVVSGDNISSKPDIILKFFDNSIIFIKDTTNIKIKLNDKYIPYFIGSMKNPDLTINFMDNNYLQAVVNFTPKLEEKDHKFEFISIDASGNRADTTRYFLSVSSVFSVYEVFNYPNPMRDFTKFTFKISGSERPEKCKIKIYTVAGRLIKSIESFPVIGFNSIEWDGRDEEGDNIANGVYLYKIIIEQAGKTETQLQKLVVLK